MKRTINKNTLSFSTSKIMKYLRTPPDIWESLSNEFKFTIDACSSDENHLCEKYYTQYNSCLDKDWTNEVVYCHPMFDMHIGNFVKKAFESKCTTVMLLPASTHTRYFHRYCYTNDNCEIRFLEKPNKGFHFGHDDGSVDEPNKIGYIKPLMILIFRNPS
jgi:phage N-6-adenine-methyltransferase